MSKRTASPDRIEVAVDGQVEVRVENLVAATEARLVATRQRRVAAVPAAGGTVILVQVCNVVAFQRPSVVHAGHYPVSMVDRRAVVHGHGVKVVPDDVAPLVLERGERLQNAEAGCK